MAKRQTKAGIDYFSHDVDMLQDRRIKIIKAKHGLIGYAIYLRLLEEIYRESGYYILADEEFNILFADDNNLDYNVYIEVLNDCIEKGLFNKELFDVHSILTSKRVQENYFSATERRKSLSLISDYLVVDLEENVDIQKINVDIITLNVDIEKQSKEKVKRKEKENKEDNILTSPSEKVDYTSIAEEYNLICISLPKCQKLSDSRKRSIKTFLNEFNRDELTTVFEKAQASSFLRDGSGTWKGATLDWLLNKKNALKVLEGNYDDKGNEGLTDTQKALKDWITESEEVIIE